MQRCHGARPGQAGREPTGGATAAGREDPAGEPECLARQVARAATARRQLATGSGGPAVAPTAPALMAAVTAAPELMAAVTAAPELMAAVTAAAAITADAGRRPGPRRRGQFSAAAILSGA